MRETSPPARHSPCDGKSFHVTVYTEKPLWICNGDGDMPLPLVTIKVLSQT